jgi:hypothetical protein
MKAQHSFETSQTIQLTKHNIPEDMNLQQHHSEDLKVYSYDNADSPNALLFLLVAPGYYFSTQRLYYQPVPQ